MKLLCVLFYFGVEAVYQFCTIYLEYILLILGDLILAIAESLLAK